MNIPDIIVELEYFSYLRQGDYLDAQRMRYFFSHVCPEIKRHLIQYQKDSKTELERRLIQDQFESGCG